MTGREEAAGGWEQGWERKGGGREGDTGRREWRREGGKGEKGRKQWDPWGRR